MGQACSSAGAAAGLTPRDTNGEASASGVAPKQGIQSGGQPGQLTSHPEKRRSTGDKHVNIVPTVTAVSSNGKATTEAIKSGQGSPIGHLPTPAASITAPLHQRPYADDASLLVAVPEESLSAAAAASQADPAGHHEEEEFFEEAAETEHMLAGQQKIDVLHEGKIPMSEDIIHQHDDELAKCSSEGVTHVASPHAARTEVSCISTVSEHSYMTAVTAADGINDEVSQSVLAVLPSAAVSRRPTNSFKTRSTCSEDDAAPVQHAAEHTQDGEHKTQRPEEHQASEPVADSKQHVEQHEVEAVSKAEQGSHEAEAIIDSEHVVEQPIRPVEAHEEEVTLDAPHKDAEAPQAGQHDPAVPEAGSDVEKPVKECSEAGALDEANNVIKRGTSLLHEGKMVAEDIGATEDCVRRVAGAAGPGQPAEPDDGAHEVEQHAAAPVLYEGVLVASSEQPAEEHVSEAAPEAEQVEVHAEQEQQE